MVKIDNIELGEFPLLLAPMEDVSDPPFRAVCKEGGADLMYTEFISSEGLIRDAAKSKQKLDIFEYERPIGIQLFGGDIGSMVESAVIASEVNPDLIDINYGCPVKAVACRGAGAALLQDIPKMVQMTSEIVKATHLPVTVKTRLGWDDNSKNIVEVAERLQDIGIKALTIHGRTRVQMYKGEADSPQKALDYKNRYGVDGIMIGRAAIGYPWIFNEIKHYCKHGERPLPPDMAERIRTAKKHLEFSIRWKGDRLGIFEMRRHYTNYFKSIPDFKPFRTRLVEANTEGEVMSIFEEIKETYCRDLVSA